MRGVVFNVLEQVVIEAAGEDEWDDLLDRAGSDGVYTSACDYEIEELLRLVEAVEGAGTTLPGRLRWIGRRAVPHLVELRADVFGAHANVASLLRRAEETVQTEVRPFTDGPLRPMFDFHHDPKVPDAFAVGCHLPGGLCAAVEGVLIGVAEHYGQTLRVTQPKCERRGFSSCLILGTLAEAAA
ncbi:MAG TPA: heme NO-binding domain-containing protein [Marmoricola sp.]|nr:heme NO-binding domain-containing protein [Marmoricola sp.]